jgi:pantoate kinase
MGAGETRGRIIWTAWDAVLDDLAKDPSFANVVELQRQWAKRVGYYSPMNAADQDLSLEHHFGRVGS